MTQKVLVRCPDVYLHLTHSSTSRMTQAFLLRAGSIHPIASAGQPVVVIFIIGHLIIVCNYSPFYITSKFS